MDDLKRDVEVVVISDVHLGTQGCRAKELLNYLKSINPEILILNGDIIDMWQFKKWYWPKTHLKVVKNIIGKAARGTKTYYISGNHDELLRKFSPIKLGKLQVVDKLVLYLNGQRVLFFHGDVFDAVMKYSKFIAKLGAISYDSLILINSIINRIIKLFGNRKVSLSKKIKDSVKSAVKYINKFEETAAIHALKKGYNQIVCGHIHKAEIRTINVNNESICYMNSGDWVESLTALEFNNSKWTIYNYGESFIDTNDKEPEDLAIIDNSNKTVFIKLLNEFKD